MGEGGVGRGRISPIPALALPLKGREYAGSTDKAGEQHAQRDTTNTLTRPAVRWRDIARWRGYLAHELAARDWDTSMDGLGHGATVRAHGGVLKVERP